MWRRLPMHGGQGSGADAAARLHCRQSKAPPATASATRPTAGAFRRLHSSPTTAWTAPAGATSGDVDGEEVARRNMQADEAPQLQKQRGKEAPAPRTAGGAYAGRDDPRPEASQPTEAAGVSDTELVREQTATGVPPSAAAPSPRYAGECRRAASATCTVTSKSVACEEEPAHPGPAAAAAAAAAAVPAGSAKDGAGVMEENEEEEALAKDIDRRDWQPWQE